MILFGVLTGCGDKPSSQLLLKAGDALREGRVDEALSYYNKVATLYPKTKVSQEAYYWIGEVYHLFKKQPDKAIDSLRKAVAEGNVTRYGEKSQKKIADIFFNDLKAYKKAIPEFQRLIDQFPASKLCAEAQFQIGQCYMAIGEYEQARLEYSTLIDRYAESEYRDDAAYRFCVAYYREGDFKNARTAYERFLLQDSESPFVVNARMGLVHTLEELGDVDGALTLLGSLEQDYPNKEIILRKVDSLLKKKNSGQPMAKQKAQ
jgi:TolA-binding protein